MNRNNSFKYDIVRDCALLDKEKTFSNLYDLICAHGNIKASVWLENGVEKFYTFDDLKALTDNYASFLAEKFGTEGRVCISLDSCKEWFPLFWGLVRSGHDVLALDASMSDDKMLPLLEQAGCKKVVSAKSHKLDSSYEQLLLSELTDLKTVNGYKPIWGHNIAICTSGTTASSRMFLYDEETICHLAMFSKKVHDENRLLIDDMNFRTLAFLPFHHILGFAAIFIWSHFLGDTMVYLKDRSPQTILETVKKCKVNQIVSVPILANSICKGLNAKISDMNFLIKGAFELMMGISLGVQMFAPRTGLHLAKSLFRGVHKLLLGTEIKSIVLGGSHTDPKTLRMLNAIGYFTICGYGMTETAITGFETSYRLSNRLKGSIGAPMSDTEYRIKGGGNVGELQIRGVGLHDGRMIDGKILPPDTEDGWFSTGDIVRVNQRLGQYFIEGRTKEMIVNESGENVYPDEMEDAFANLKDVEQYTVLGIARKDKSSHYEDITLVLNIGNKYADGGFIEELGRQIRQINNGFPVFKRLSRVLVTDTKLPVANGFKVKRLELKKLIETGKFQYRDVDLSAKKGEEKVVATSSESTAPVADDDIFAKIRDIYAEILNIPAESIDPDMNFIDDLGGDSLQVLSIATMAENTFGVIINDESFARCATVNDATSLIHELLNGTTATSARLVEREPVTSFVDSEEYKIFKKRHDGMLEAGDDNPYFVEHDSPLLDTSRINGKDVIDFGGYNYVGMSGRPEVKEAAKKAIDKYGTSASGSRLLAGEKPVHGELERAIAEWKHAEAAVVCVGGHSTNVTFVGNFCGKNDLILYDALAHNSVEQGCRLSPATTKPFPHDDVEALDKILEKQRKYFEKVLIIIEGVYSMDGDISNVPGFVALKKKYGCFLMVDEAHSACVLGPTGGGVDEYFGLAPDDVDIKMGTLSKGLGTCGGYLAGKKEIIEYLKYNMPGFVFSVGISPALAAGSLEAIHQLRTNPSIMENLHRNIECFAREARKRKLDICLAGKSAVLPVLIGKDEDAFRMSSEMTRRGVFVPPAVSPAVPKNKARLRFDVISEHTEQQIIYALDTLVQTAKDLGIELPLREY